MFSLTVFTYPVSNFAYELLSGILYDPVFNVAGISRQMVHKVKELNMAASLRRQLYHLKDFIRVCRLADRSVCLSVCLSIHICCIRCVFPLVCHLISNNVAILSSTLSGLCFLFIISFFYIKENLFGSLKICFQGDSSMLMAARYKID